jgi:hypothetical protein
MTNMDIEKSMASCRVNASNIIVSLFVRFLHKVHKMNK